jgi:hypothetical protein
MWRVNFLLKQTKTKPVPSRFAMARHIYRPGVEVKVMLFFLQKIMLFNFLFWYNDDFELNGL